MRYDVIVIESTRKIGAEAAAVNEQWQQLWCIMVRLFLANEQFVLNLLDLPDVYFLDNHGNKNIQLQVAHT